MICKPASSYHSLAQSVLPTTKEKLSCIKHFDISRFGLKMQSEENSVFRQFIYVINKWIKLATLALKLYDHRKKQIGELTTGTMIILSFNKPLLWKMVRKSSCSAASQCCPMLFHDWIRLTEHVTNSWLTYVYLSTTIQRVSGTFAFATLTLTIFE